MKTRLIWRRCWISNNKNCFWIECTDEEVSNCILGHVDEKKDKLLQEINRNRGHSLINKNINEQIYCNFFLISTDLKNIQSYAWQMPYGGMWNASNPFREIDVVDFHGLNELKRIYRELPNGLKSSQLDL